MRNKVSLVLLVLVQGSSACFADFKYTESVEVSGGVMEGMMDFWNSFSQQPTEPAVIIHCLKGNRLRTEKSDGKVLIIDLDARRFTEIDTQQHTYSVLSFDDLQAALKKMHAEADEDTGKMVPKVNVTKTDNTKMLREQNARETTVQLEMQHPGEGAKPRRPSLRITSDLWLVESNPGFEEMRKFNQQLAKELDWVPGTTLTGNLEMTQAMLDLRNTVAGLDALPILQHASIAMVVPPPPPPPPAAPTGAQNPASAQPAMGPGTPAAGNAAASTATAAMVPQVAVAKGIIGFLGKRRKGAAAAQPGQQPAVSTQPPASATAPAATQPPPAPSNAPGNHEQAAANTLAGMTLADVTVEVTSFSTGVLNPTLFKVPAGYRRVKESAEQLLGEKAESSTEAERQPPRVAKASGDGPGASKDPAAAADKGNKASASKAEGAKQQ